MELRQGYKRTEAGVIPEEWDVRTLAEDIRLISGHHILAQYCNTEGRGVPYITGPADFPNGKITNTKFTDRPSTICDPFDILVTVKGSGSGTLTIADSAYCISRQLMAIRVVSWDRVFLFYSLLQNATQIKSASTGLIPGLSRADILEQKIPIPRVLEEQHDIATALSDVDALLEGLERLIAKKRDLKQAAMQQLLTGQTRLPGFSGKWKQKPLDALSAMKSGSTITSANIDQFSNYPCYGGNGLRGYTSHFTHDGMYVLIGRQGALCGNVFGVEGQFFASEHAIVVTPFAETDVRWLAYALTRMNLNQYSESSAQPGLSVSKILKLEVFAPPTKDEQSAIATALTNMDSELSAWEQRLVKTSDLKQSMMQELLTGRTRLL